MRLQVFIIISILLNSCAKNNTDFICFYDIKDVPLFKKEMTHKIDSVLNKNNEKRKKIVEIGCNYDINFIKATVKTRDKIFYSYFLFDKNVKLVNYGLVAIHPLY